MQHFIPRLLSFHTFSPMKKRCFTGEPNPPTEMNSKAFKLRGLPSPRLKKSQFKNVLPSSFVSVVPIPLSPQGWNSARLQIGKTHWGFLFFKGRCWSPAWVRFLLSCLFLTDVRRLPGTWCLQITVVWFCGQAIGEIFGLSFAEEKQMWNYQRHSWTRTAFPKQMPKFRWCENQ